MRAEHRHHSLVTPFASIASELVSLQDELGMDCGILSLPNEVFLNVFRSLSVRELLPLTSTCKRFYFLLCRELAQRLRNAQRTAGSALYLSCHHPAAIQFNVPRYMRCALIETDGLDDICDECKSGSPIDQLGRLRGLYTRFQPQHRGSGDVRLQRHPAGDVRGSRTYIDEAARLLQQTPSRMITVDAYDLFTQLQAEVGLGRWFAGGSFVPIRGISRGMLRIWRDWLSRQCETRSFSDNTTVLVNHDAEDARDDSDDPTIKPENDSSILWTTGDKKTLGVWLRVLSQYSDGDVFGPHNEAEGPVSYVIHIEEVLIRTAELLFNVEEAAELHDTAEQTILFGFQEQW